MHAFASQDDFPLNLRLLSRLLHLRGFDVTAVPDGGAALDALLASFRTAEAGAEAGAGAEEAPQPQPLPFDLAVLDMEMPVMSGPQAAAAFRQWEEGARPGAMRLPIVSLTANVHEQVSLCLTLITQAVPLKLTARPHARLHCSMPRSAPAQAWCVLA
jgi:CheY-like chemotaxis protein